jgi:hypothetical protein
MHCTPARFSIIAVLVALSLVQEPAAAARPWQDIKSKPGNGNSRKWSGNAPTISGTPASLAEVDQFYAFQASANDTDGDTLLFSITNKPSWAAFDTAHGYLSGYPAENDAGTETTGIVIGVSDGRNTASLPPFSIRVSASTNLPPVISGTAPAEALVGKPYSFAPVAKDPEGKPLLFRVANRPAWASFDASNGRLHGTPDSGDVGVYGNIRITVSDGTSSTSTPAFSIAVVETTTGSVTLSWNPPTENVDGTPLLDLAGYTIYYGTIERQYDHSLKIDNPGVTSAVIGNLGLGTWHFAATATTAAGLESDPSAEVTRVID